MCIKEGPESKFWKLCEPGDWRVKMFCCYEILEIIASGAILFEFLLKTEKSRRVTKSHQVCVGLKNTFTQRRSEKVTA
jgi:hypothetical protein